MLAIADAYDAMTSDRPYRKALSHDEALREIRRYAVSSLIRTWFANSLPFMMNPARTARRLQTIKSQLRKTGPMYEIRGSYAKCRSVLSLGLFVCTVQWL
jgi:hypothetical protein